MRRSPLAAALALATVVALSGCATAPAAEPDQTTPAAPSDTPSPTPEPLLVGPSERPPTAFAGDCSAAISPVELSEAYGFEVADVSSRDERWTRSIVNAGGLSCEWEGGRLDVIPRSGLGGAVLTPESTTYYLEKCDWTCTWVWEDDAVWIAGSDWRPDGRSREKIDAIGAALGPLIAERWAAEPAWQRDRTGWWPVFDCDQLAAAIGAQLGATLTSQPVGYHDPAGPAVEIADSAMHQSWCALARDGADVATVTTQAGTAWAMPPAEDASPIELGVPGFETFVRENPSFGDAYSSTEGVNVVVAEISSGAPWTAQQIATAIAAAAASGFQL